MRAKIYMNFCSNVAHVFFKFDAKFCDFLLRNSLRITPFPYLTLPCKILYIKATYKKLISLENFSKVDFHGFDMILEFFQVADKKCYFVARLWGYTISYWLGLLALQG